MMPTKRSRSICGVFLKIDMSLNHGQLKRRRINLLKEDPHCFWCRKKLFYKKPSGNYGVLPENFATIDHINSKLFGKRPVNGKLVLACPPCNNRRQKEEHYRNIWLVRFKTASLPWYLELINIILRIKNKHRKYVNFVNLFFPLVWLSWKCGIYWIKPLKKRNHEDKPIENGLIGNFSGYHRLDGTPYNFKENQEEPL